MNTLAYYEHSLIEEENSFGSTAQCYKTFFLHFLLMFVKRWSVCPLQAFAVLTLKY